MCIRDSEHARAPTLQAGPPRGDLLAHVGDVEVGDATGPLEQRHRTFGLVGVDVDLERRLVADDEHRVAEALEAGQEVARGEPCPRDDEVGAVCLLYTSPSPR